MNVRVSQCVSLMVILGLIFPVTGRAEGEWLVKSKGNKTQQTLWFDGSVTKMDLTKGDPKTDFHQSENEGHRTIPALGSDQKTCPVANLLNEEELKKKKKATPRQPMPRVAEVRRPTASASNGRPGVGHLIPPRPCDLPDKKDVRSGLGNSVSRKAEVGGRPGLGHLVRRPEVSGGRPGRGHLIPPRPCDLPDKKDVRPGLGNSVPRKAEVGGRPGLGNVISRPAAASNGRPGLGTQTPAPRPASQAAPRVREVPKALPPVKKEPKNEAKKHQGLEHGHKEKPASQHTHKILPVPAINPAEKPASHGCGVKPAPVVA